MKKILIVQSVKVVRLRKEVPVEELSNIGVPVVVPGFKSIELILGGLTVS